MADYLVRGITDTHNIIGLACVTTDLVEEAARLHGTSPTASAALGRALTGGLLMGALLKRGQRIGLKFEGDGPLRKIIVEADHEGAVRGYVGVPDVEVPAREGKLNVSGALGSEGTLTVIKDLGLKEPYSGIVKLRTGEVAEDIAYYFAESEQVPSAVGLGVFVEKDGIVSAAGGFLVQTLITVEDRLIDQIIANIEKIPFITEFLRQGKMPEEILAEIFSGVPYHILEKQNLGYRCPCSREKVERALIALGKDELQTFLEKGEETEVTCEYCRTNYLFTILEINNLIREITPPSDLPS